MKNHNAQNQVRRDITIDGKIYRWVDDPLLTDADKNVPNTVLLSMKDFLHEGGKRNQGFFTTISPEEILSHLT